MGKKGFFDIIEYCECGCGEIPKSDNRFVHGHNGRVDNFGRKATEKARKNISQALMGNKNRLAHYHDEKARKNISEGRKGIKADPILEKGVLCGYGCEGLAYYRLKNGKFCCYSHPAGCSARKVYGKKKFRAGLVLEAGIICSYGCGQQAYYKFKNGKFCCSINPSGCLAIKSGSKQKKKRKSLFTIGMLCSYGCGQEAKTQFKNGKFCCTLTSNKCPAIRKELKGRTPWNKNRTKKDDLRLASISERMEGVPLSEEHKNKLSLAKIGRPSSRKGRSGPPQTEKAKKQIGITLKKKYAEGIVRPWSKGLTKETDLRVAKAVEKRSKKLKEDYATGKRKAKAAGLTKETDARLASTSEKLLGRVQPLEQTRKIRLKAIKRVSEASFEGRQICPACSPRACEFFERFDKDFNTQGRYGTNGGEYFIKELGYWPDYINFNLKLIMEWDEEDHYNGSGVLKKKDVRRQEEIQKYFPDFRFVRIREKFQEGMGYSFMKIGRQE